MTNATLLDDGRLAVYGTAKPTSYQPMEVARAVADVVWELVHRGCPQDEEGVWRRRGRCYHVTTVFESYNSSGQEAAGEEGEKESNR